jgi:hypothetical protein
MNIYSFAKVTDFINQYVPDIYHSARECNFKKLYHDLYDDLTKKTMFLGKATFVERIYCFVNLIKDRPKCRHCDNHVTFMKVNGYGDGNERGYHTYCSQRCSMLDMETLIGVPNFSQLDSVKEKKKETFMKNYGVDNYAKTPPGKLTSHLTRCSYWDSILKGKKETGFGLTREQYKGMVKYYTNKQYDLYKNELDPIGIRSREFHVDHVYSILDGFMNDVPVHVISDISNLRLMLGSDNMSKNKSSYKTLSELYEDYYIRNRKTD